MNYKEQMRIDFIEWLKKQPNFEVLWAEFMQEKYWNDLPLNWR